MTDYTLLRLRTEALDRVARERDAFRALLGQSIGSGIDLTEYEAVLIHKPCGQLADPATHVCGDGA